jgi:hypothetical protein
MISDKNYETFLSYDEKSDLFTLKWCQVWEGGGFEVLFQNTMDRENFEKLTSCLIRKLKDSNLYQAEMYKKRVEQEKNSLELANLMAEKEPNEEQANLDNGKAQGQGSSRSQIESPELIQEEPCRFNEELQGV